MDGILAMVENDRYCVDISNQMAAVHLTKANKEILKAHMAAACRRRLKAETRLGEDGRSACACR
ncbi:MAG: metal-sensing transcriptional repressor [Ruthenibacterium lactatiformans]